MSCCCAAVLVLPDAWSDGVTCVANMNSRMYVAINRLVRRPTRNSTPVFVFVFFHNAQAAVDCLFGDTGGFGFNFLWLRVKRSRVVDVWSGWAEEGSKYCRCL